MHFFISLISAANEKAMLTILIHSTSFYHLLHFLQHCNFSKQRAKIIPLQEALLLYYYHALLQNKTKNILKRRRHKLQFSKLNNTYFLPTRLRRCRPTNLLALSYQATFYSMLCFCHTSRLYCNYLILESYLSYPLLIKQLTSALERKDSASINA